MTRLYIPAWTTLKTTGKLELTVSKAAMKKVLYGIKLEKCIENVARRQAGLVGWSKLVVVKEPISSTMYKITLTFLYSTAL